MHLGRNGVEEDECKKENEADDATERVERSVSELRVAKFLGGWQAGVRLGDGPFTAISSLVCHKKIWLDQLCTRTCNFPQLDLKYPCLRYFKANLNDGS
jgi:hypothetical protein